MSRAKSFTAIMLRRQFGAPLVAYLLALAFWPASATAADGQTVTLPLTTSVKRLEASDASAESNRQSDANSPASQQPLRPTLPSGKLPQYQLDRDPHSDFSNTSPDSGTIRFLLRLPTEVLLIEATMSIDGRPYPHARDERVKDILRELRQNDSGEQPPGSATQGAASPRSQAEPSSAPGEPSTENAPATTSTPSYTLPSTAAEYIRRYARNTSADISPEEVAWIITHRIDGPTLLVLNDNFQLFRARQRPAFDVLDRDRDQRVSAEELLRAAESLRECDLNRDDIIHFTEIARAAKDVRRQREPSPLGMPIIGIGALAASQDAKAREPIPRHFDGNQNGQWDTDELLRLQTAEPDLAVAVSFNSQSPEQSILSLTTLDARLRESAESFSAADSSIELTWNGAMIELSAVQGGRSDQVALGAVIDGYPLLPVIDPNDDGRITIRELRQLAESLRPFDRNKDGELTLEETRPTLRVCFSCGPHVHRELATIRSAKARPSSTAPPAPDWFVRMDRNKDHDLTRGEFPGTDEQFQSLDADHDELISTQEAAEFRE